ncbi:MAG TPA: TonB-dependent receptor [Candidatus Dormibacteraeota bacterium]|nr:TonB-dependent receptor [Candidatus Dormibacteraeota bacterium]
MHAYFRAFARTSLCASLLLAPCGIALAAAPTPAATSTPLTTIVRVVTADRNSEALAHVARSTYVITGKQIAAHGWTSVAQALNAVPGIFITRYGPGAGASLSMRGATADETLVLLDGIPLRGMQLGAPDLSTVSTSGIERIEVVEGGGSTLYGSGSIGGVINIITAPRKTARAAFTTGSFGTQDVRIGLPFLSVERYVANNAYALPDGTTRENADVERSTIRSDIARHFGRLGVRLDAGLTSEHLGVPGNYGNFTPTSRQDSVDSYLHSRFSIAGKQSESVAQLGASTDSLAYTSCIGAGCQTVSRYASVSLNLRNRVLGDRSTFLYGIDLSRGTSQIDNSPSGIATPSVAQSALYLQQEWSLAGNGSLYAGVRGEHDGTAGGSLSPAIGGRFALGSGTQLQANLATAFRAPTVFELYFPCPVTSPCSNPNLQPERARVGDLTLSNTHIMGGLALTYFDTSARNLIDYAPPTFIPVNVGQASLQGFTFDARTKPLNGISVHASITDLYRALDLGTNSRIYGRGPVIASRVTLDYLPAHVSRFGMSGWGVTASTAGLRDDPANEIYFDSSGNPQPNPPFAQAIPYTNVSAFVRFRVGAHANLTLRGENLGNERYAQVSGYPMPGRSFALELSGH